MIEDGVRRTDAHRWLTSWSASPSGFAGGYTAPESTVRQTLRLSAGGSAIRLRFANPHTYAPLELRSVTAARAVATSAAVRTTPVSVTVSGRPSFVVHPGTILVTDPIALTVADLETITVSSYVEAPVAMCGHEWANRTLWATLGNVGDRTMDTDAAAFRPAGFGWLWVDAVDVLEPAATSAVVALGDSITDGAGSDFDSDTRWPDLLASRLLALPAGDTRRRSVVNAGIGGNTVGGVGTELVGINALSRLDRDAQSLTGVSDIIVAGGSNDLFLGRTPTALIADLTILAQRIAEAGKGAHIATIAPRRGGYQWDDAAEERRREVNTWIRSQSVFRSIVDFASVLDDPVSPGSLRPEFDADGTHPNSAGYLAMAEAVDIGIFAEAPTRSARASGRADATAA